MRPTPSVAAEPPPPVSAPDPSRWFADEVQTHDALLRNYLRHAFHDIRDVDDIVQESYLRLWKARAVQPIRSAKAFLFKIAQRVALDSALRQRSSPVVAVGDLDALPVLESQPGAVETALRNERLRVLVEALAALPPRCREITVLRKLKGIPQKEVAAQLGLSERTIEEQVARGVRRCKAFCRRRMEGRP